MRLPAAVREFASVTYRRKAIASAIQPPTTSAVPALTHFGSRRSLGAKRISSAKAEPMRRIARAQRPNATGRRHGRRRSRAPR